MPHELAFRWSTMRKWIINKENSTTKQEGETSWTL
nr:MAG TPA: hypothetical protein [Caudoviricetes sp.]